MRFAFIEQHVGTFPARLMCRVLEVSPSGFYAWRSRPESARAASDPIEGDWPYVWLDATYIKARRDNQIVSVAVIVAVGVNTDGRREVLGMTVGHSEAEPFWVQFLRSLARRGLRGTKLGDFGSSRRPQAAITKTLNATWQRCRVGLLKKPSSSDSLAPATTRYGARCWEADLGGNLSF